MESRREAEPDPRFIDAPRHGVSVELEGHAERLEQISRTARRRGGSVAVLADRRTRAGHDQGRQRRNVDGVAAVAAGADDVDEPVAHLVGHIDRRGDGEHRVEQAVELLDGLALHAQRDGEAGDLGRGRRTLQDLGHGGARLVVGQVLVAGETPEHRAPSPERLEARRLWSIDAAAHRRPPVGVDQAVRRRWRMILRRSRSVAPPQMPSFSRWVMACSRQDCRTVQSAQMLFAVASSSRVTG